MLIVLFLAFRSLNILVLIVLSFDCVAVACERRNSDRISITVSFLASFRVQDDNDERRLTET